MNENTKQTLLELWSYSNYEGIIKLSVDMVSGVGAYTVCHVQLVKKTVYLQGAFCFELIINVTTATCIVSL